MSDHEQRVSNERTSTTVTEVSLYMKRKSMTDAEVIAEAYRENDELRATVSKLQAQLAAQEQSRKVLAESHARLIDSVIKLREYVPIVRHPNELLTDWTARVAAYNESTRKLAEARKVQPK